MSVVEHVRKEQIHHGCNFKMEEAFDLMEMFAKASELQPDTKGYISQRTSCHVRSSREDILDLACKIALSKGWENVTWRRNFSALHLAAKIGDTEAVKKLLHEACAAPALTLLDNHKKTPLDYAMELPAIDLELLELLDPLQATFALSSKSYDVLGSPQRKDRVPNARELISRKCISSAKLRTIPGKKLLDSVPHEPRSDMSTHAIDQIDGAETDFVLPSLLSSRGFASEPHKGKMPSGDKL